MLTLKQTLRETIINRIVDLRRKEEDIKSELRDARELLLDFDEKNGDVSLVSTPPKESKKKHPGGKAGRKWSGSKSDWSDIPSILKKSGKDLTTEEVFVQTKVYKAEAHKFSKSRENKLRSNCGAILNEKYKAKIIGVGKPKDGLKTYRAL